MKIVLKEPIMKKPPGGRYGYQENNVTYDGDTPEALARKVAHYRMVHGKPLGDPLEDVMAYIYERWPYLCKVVKELSGTPHQDESQIPVEERAYNWLLKQNASDHVADLNHLQAERAKVCQDCPMNVMTKFADPQKQQQYDRTAYVVTGGRMMGGFFRLGICQKYGWDNRVVCARKPESLPSDAPETCWIGKDS